jgi:hypothetical protein
MHQSVEVTSGCHSMTKFVQVPLQVCTSAAANPNRPELLFLLWKQTFSGNCNKLDPNKKNS